MQKTLSYRHCLRTFPNFPIERLHAVCGSGRFLKENIGASRPEEHNVLRRNRSKYYVTREQKGFPIFHRLNYDKTPKERAINSRSFQLRIDYFYRGWVTFAMATRKGINISGHCVVHHKCMPFCHVCTLYSKKLKGRT